MKQFKVYLFDLRRSKKSPKTSHMGEFLVDSPLPRTSDHGAPSRPRSAATGAAVICCRYYSL